MRPGGFSCLVQAGARDAPTTGRRRWGVALIWVLACALGLVQVILGRLSGELHTQPLREAKRQSPEASPPREVPASLLVLARTQPRQKTPVLPRPESPPSPPVPSPAIPEPTGPAGPAEVGGFPALVASYDALGGLGAYLAEMRRLGARVFVGNLESRRLVAEVDPASYGIWTGFRPVAGLAIDRPRILRDDRATSPVLRQASTSLGPGAYALVLLVPQEVESKILGVFQRELARQGRAPRDFVSIRGTYQRGPRGLVLHLDEAIDRAGKSFPLNAALELGG